MTSQENLVEDANTCPRVTYVIAAYNAETTLGDALDSLTRQRCADWAAIVVDDGSTDGTLEIACARAQQDERVQVLSQANAGPAKARNAGVEHAHSEFVACLDADDELTDDHLSTMLDLVGRNPDFEVYGSDGCFVHPDGSRVPVFGYSDIRSLALEDVLAGSPIMGGGTLIRTDAFRALGGFRSEIYCEDYDLWLRALAAGCRHIATSDRLYLYRVGGPSQKSADRIASANSAIRALGDLIASGRLSCAQAAAAERAIAESRANLVLETQAVHLRQAIQRVFGVRMTPPIMLIAHSVSWVTRPARRWFARRKFPSDRR